MSKAAVAFPSEKDVQDRSGSPEGLVLATLDSPIKLEEFREEQIDTNTMDRNACKFINFKEIHIYIYIM